VGKANTPEVLTKKAGNYEDFEWLIIKRHTLDGARILEGSRSAYLTMAEAIARTHHERWDGSGYPNRLEGETIPLGGRICAIADVFDALTTSRSYKQTVGIDEAFRLIVASGGKLFDPKLVKVFESRYHEIIRIKQMYSA
jgi:putative two-component system response regulator